MECDREENFRGEITYYDLKESPTTGSVMLNLTVSISEIYNRQSRQWEDWPYDMVASGAVCLVTGNVNRDTGERQENRVLDKAVASISAATGWNGDWAALAANEIALKPISFSTKYEKYDGVERWRINFISPFDSAPHGRGNVDTEKAKSLNAKYGAQSRAIAGSANKPKAPSTPPPKTTTKLQTETTVPGASASNRAAVAAANAVDEESTPF